MTKITSVFKSTCVFILLLLLPFLSGCDNSAVSSGTNDRSGSDSSGEYESVYSHGNEAVTISGDSSDSNSEREEYMTKSIAYRAKIIKADVISGENNGIRLLDGMLSLDDSASSGYIITDPIYIGKFDHVIASWGCTSNGGSLEVSIAYELARGGYSEFYSYGIWSDGNKRSRPRSDDNADMRIDTLYTENDASGYIKLKLQLKRSDAAKSPELRYIAVAANSKAEQLLIAELPDEVLLDVPVFSQMVVPDIGRRICSPTSLAMVFNYLGTELTPSQTAAGVYDIAADIYGNWAFNVAFAAEKGYLAYVDIYDQDMVALKYTLSRGIPVICSIATTDKGQLAESPMAYPGGHLLVVCGYKTVEGVEYFIVNDPAAPAASSVRRMYRADQFVRAWNGVVYIIQ